MSEIYSSTTTSLGEIYKSSSSSCIFIDSGITEDFAENEAADSVLEKWVVVDVDSLTSSFLQVELVELVLFSQKFLKNLELEEASFVA